MAIVATVTHNKTLLNPSTGSADKVYGVDYVSSTSHVVTWTGLAANGILLSDGTDLTQSAYFTASDSLVNSAPGLKVGTTGTTSGLQFGYQGASGYGALWASAVTATSSNYALRTNGSDVTINAGAGGVIYFASATVAKAAIGAANGNGLSITAGTATTDVNAFSATQTWNNVAVAFTAWKLNVTNTTSAAGSLLADLQVATVSKFKIDKDGITTIASLAGTGTRTVVVDANGVMSAP